MYSYIIRPLRLNNTINYSTNSIVTCSGINLAELIDKLEVIEALTLVSVTESRSMLHQRGRRYKRLLPTLNTRSLSSLRPPYLKVSMGVYMEII
jgi:hypothetical protein